MPKYIVLLCFLLGASSVARGQDDSYAREEARKAQAQAIANQAAIDEAKRQAEAAKREYEARREREIQKIEKGLDKGKTAPR